MGAKRYEMRSAEDRARRRAITAQLPKCPCGNVASGKPYNDGLCGACRQEEEDEKECLTPRP